MKRIIVLTLLCLTASAAFGQSRDIPIYLPPTAGGTPEQQQFFADQFKMELAGAKYPVVDSIDKAMYSMPLSVSNNELFGDEGEKQYVLLIVLIRTKDNAEIVRFEFPFNTLQEMYDWNLFLVYRTMGNAVAYYDYEAEGTAVEKTPEPKPIERNDLWRNKWLYAVLGVSLDPSYVQQSDGRLRYGFVLPTLTAGAELQFLDFLSVELDAKVRLLEDGENIAVSAAAALLIKGVFKFSNAMLEPYAGAEYTLALGGNEVPWLSGILGVQLGLKCTETSAVALDVGVTRGFVGVLKLVDGSEHNLLRFHIGAGWKIGFINRK